MLDDEVVDYEVAEDTPDDDANSRNDVNRGFGVGGPQVAYEDSQEQQKRTIRVTRIVEALRCICVHEERSDDACRKTTHQRCKRRRSVFRYKLGSSDN